MAELPPVTVSTRSRRSFGIVLTSGRFTPGVAVTMRRPFTSTSVRDVPRPRKSSALMPAVPMKRVEFAWLKVERNCGNWLSVSPIDSDPRDNSSVADTVVIGTGESRFGREIRVPVTMIWSLVTSSAACGAAVCAKVTSGATIATPASAVALKKRNDFMKNTPTNTKCESTALCLNETRS